MKNRIERTKAVTQQFSSQLAMPIYAMFWALDVVYYPQLKWEFLSIRLVTLTICFYCWRAIRNSKNMGQLNWAFGTLGIVMANSILLMVAVTEGIDSDYVFGVNLVGAGLLAIFPWQGRPVYIVSILLFMPLFIFLGASIETAKQIPQVMLIAAFATSTALIAIAARLSAERLYAHAPGLDTFSTDKITTDRNTSLGNNKYKVPPISHPIRTKKATPDLMTGFFGTIPEKPSASEQDLNTLV